MVECELHEVEGVLTEHKRSHKLVAVVARTVTEECYGEDDTSGRHPWTETKEMRELYFEDS